MEFSEKKQRLVYQPDGYDPIIARWVWALEDTRMRTKNAILDLNQVVLNWSPTDTYNSIGIILYHIAAIEMSYLYEDILMIGWSDELGNLLPYDIRDEAGHLSKIRNESLQDHINRLDRTRQLFLNSIKEMTVEDFRRVRDTGEYVTTPEWIVHHLMQHEAEHRGEINEIRSRAEKDSQNNT